MPPFSELRLGRVALVGLGVIVLSLLVVMLVVTVYAVFLAIQAQGAPDQERIAAFGKSISSWVGTLIRLLFLFLGAAWTARRVPMHKSLHGVLVGIFVAVISILMDAIGGVEALDLVGFVLAIGAGWLGGVVGAGRRSEV